MEHLCIAQNYAINPRIVRSKQPITAACSIVYSMYRMDIGPTGQWLGQRWVQHCLAQAAEVASLLQCIFQCASLLCIFWMDLLPTWAANVPPGHTLHISYQTLARVNTIGWVSYTHMDGWFRLVGYQWHSSLQLNEIGKWSSTRRARGVINSPVWAWSVVMMIRVNSEHK